MGVVKLDDVGIRDNRCEHRRAGGPEDAQEQTLADHDCRATRNGIEGTKPVRQREELRAICGALAMLYTLVIT